MKINSLIIAILMILLISESHGQWNSHIEFTTGFAGGVNMSIKGETLITEKQKIQKTDNKFSLGLGNEFGVFYSISNDSSDILLSTGIIYAESGRNTINSIQNKDLDQYSFNSMHASAIYALAGIGYQKTFKSKVLVSGIMGLKLPAYISITEDVYLQKEESWELTEWKYKVNFLPGFWAKAGVGVKLSPNVVFNTSCFFSFMNLFERKASITNYSSSSNTLLLERYKTPSEREVYFKNNLSDIQNEPTLYPDTFNPNKPIETLGSSLPFSNMGISFSIIWTLTKNKEQEN